jgi:hypothetical protein
MYNQREERKRKEAEAKVEYDKHPVRCPRPGCGTPLSFGQFIRGHEFCSALCAKEHVSALKRGKPNPRRPQSSSTGNG